MGRILYVGPLGRVPIPRGERETLYVRHGEEIELSDKAVREQLAANPDHWIVPLDGEPQFLTEAAYNALETKDLNTLYAIRA